MCAEWPPSRAVEVRCIAELLGVKSREQVDELLQHRPTWHFTGRVQDGQDVVAVGHGRVRARSRSASTTHPWPAAGAAGAEPSEPFERQRLEAR